MQYLTDIGVNVEDASLFYALDVLKADSFGELTKTGFVEGWLATPYVVSRWLTRRPSRACVPFVVLRGMTNH